MRAGEWHRTALTWADVTVLTLVMARRDLKRTASMGTVMVGAAMIVTGISA